MSGEVLRPTESCFIVLERKPEKFEPRKQYDETNSEKAWNLENGDLRFANVHEVSSKKIKCGACAMMKLRTEPSHVQKLGELVRKLKFSRT